MRSLICDDETLDQLIGEGGPFDYELGERYFSVPPASFQHGRVSGQLFAALAAALPDAEVSIGPGLGIIEPVGHRWYVVPDILVAAPAEDTSGASISHALIAVEVRSAAEDVANMLAAYREVAAKTGMTVVEVWYVDGAGISVFPTAGPSEGETSFSDALAACLGVLSPA
ncbi:MAG: Uma2 family endonuclease [Acidimicrobiales bacterium]